MSFWTVPNEPSLAGTQVLKGCSWRRPQLEQPKRLVYKKIIKPLMEKRRRNRIAHCLSQLKTLLIDAPGQGQKHLPNSRMDKAALLEMAVQRIQTLQLAVAEDKAFHSGYSYCASLAQAFLISETRQRTEPRRPSASASNSTRETMPPVSSVPEPEIFHQIENTPGSADLRCLARCVPPSIPNTSGPQLFWRPWSS